MALSDDIANADLSPLLAGLFQRELFRVAQTGGSVDKAVFDAIRDLVGAGSVQADEEPAPASLDALWPHGELFVRACVHVALLDGRYDISEARLVSDIAHGLGISASRLAELERAVFAELRSAVRELSR